MAWRKYRLVLCNMGRVRIEFVNSVAQGMFWLMGMPVVLRMMEFVLVVAILVHTPFDPKMRCRMGNVAVRCRFLWVSR